MSSTISAGTTAGTAIAISGDTSGQLVLQTNGTTTAMTISTGQVVTLAQPLPVASGGSGVITSTGTGANVLGTSPTLATPTFNSAQLATVVGTAPLYMARAWVNFNGTGTVAISASGNVSSITDNGTGDYTVNFTTAMSDANYMWGGGAGFDNQNTTAWVTAPPSVAKSTWKQAGLLRIGTCYTNNIPYDVSDIAVVVFR